MNDEPTSDDFEPGDEVAGWFATPSDHRRLALEVTFDATEADWICSRAEALGMRLTEFVRRAALEKADANRVIVRPSRA